jgi:hypothetical protein
MEARIDAELHTAKASLRSLIGALGKIEQLAAKFPQHPKLGAFSARLDTLVTQAQRVWCEDGRGDAQACSRSCPPCDRCSLL